MTTDLLSDVTRTNVDFLRRATSPLASLSPEDLQPLSLVCELLARAATVYCERVRARLGRGVEAGKLRASMTLLDASIQAIDDFIQTLPQQPPPAGLNP